MSSAVSFDIGTSAQKEGERHGAAPEFTSLRSASREINSRSSSFVNSREEFEGRIRALALLPFLQPLFTLSLSLLRFISHSFSLYLSRITSPGRVYRLRYIIPAGYRRRGDRSRVRKEDSRTAMSSKGGKSYVRNRGKARTCRYLGNL